MLNFLKQFIILILSNLNLLILLSILIEFDGLGTAFGVKKNVIEVHYICWPFITVCHNKNNLKQKYLHTIF